MTLLNWTLWTIGVGIGGLFPSLFTLFQYFNIKRRSKKTIVFRSLLSTVIILFVVFIFGFVFVIEEKPSENLATKEDLARLETAIEKLSTPTLKEVEGELAKQFDKEYQKKKKAALEEFNIGMSAYSNNNNMLAIIHFERAINAFQIPWFYIMRGNSYALIDQFDEAIVDYGKAVSVNLTPSSRPV